MPKLYLSILLILLFVPAVAEAEGQPVGIIKTLEGDATVLRGEQKIASVIGIVVLKGDIIETSASGTVGILFNDDSIISLGPESKLDMKDFAFNPKEEKFAVFMKMLKGDVCLYFRGHWTALSGFRQAGDPFKHYWHTGDQGFDRSQGSINKYGLYYSKMG